VQRTLKVRCTLLAILGDRTVFSRKAGRKRKENQTMTRKLAVPSSLVLIAIAVGALIWTRSAQGFGVNTTGEAQAVRETILRSRRVDAEAAYNFETDILSTVYINDPRGGVLAPEAVSYIQEVRQDSTIRADELGNLDLMEAVIERRKRDYDNYMADLQAKQANGTINEEERLILEGETYGWSTPEPHVESAAAMPTQICVDVPAEAQQEYTTGYPGPQLPNEGPAPAYPVPETDYSELEPTRCIPAPTPIPTSLPPVMMVPHRGPNPATLPPESFEIEIHSIKIEGEVARAIVHKTGVTSELVLVKVNGRWYIAGAKLLKSVTP
jgi:hypothetical protein